MGGGLAQLASERDAPSSIPATSTFFQEDLLLVKLFCLSVPRQIARKNTSSQKRLKISLGLGDIKIGYFTF